MAISSRLVASVVALDPLAVLILGPTGSGKTALSLALGERFGGEVVSCDSVAVYRGLDVGSAKPSAEEQRRLPHHLIDVVDPNEHFTAGDYARQAREAMRAIADRGRLPIVTGGTGLYLRALTIGLFPGPGRQEDLRARLSRSAERQAPGWLHRVLTRLDGEAAGRIHANDIPKLIRALEIRLTAKTSVAEAFESGRDALTGFRLLRIGLNPPRAELYDRLNRRAAGMFNGELLEETRALIERYGRVRSLDSLGYRQALGVLDGTITREAGIAAAQQGHRNYAKRQLTWFRREPDVYWIEDFGSSAESVRRTVERVQSHFAMREGPKPNS